MPRAVSAPANPSGSGARRWAANAPAWVAVNAGARRSRIPVDLLGHDGGAPAANAGRVGGNVVLDATDRALAGRNELRRHVVDQHGAGLGAKELRAPRAQPVRAGRQLTGFPDAGRGGLE
jgi:hypothetical protein